MKAKPRRLRKPFISRCECTESEDGERIVDLSVDFFDGRHSAKDLKQLSDWLKKAASWLTEKSEATA
jgi:hypothetical protein